MARNTRFRRICCGSRAEDWVQSGHSQFGSLLWDWRRWSGSFIKNHSAEFTSVYSESWR